MKSCAFPLPQAFTLPDLNLFSCTMAHMSPKLATEILEMDRVMCDVISFLVVCYVVIFEAGDETKKCFNDIDQATMVAGLQKTVGAARMWMNSATGCIAEAPLKRSVPMCTRWVECTAVFAAEAEKKVLQCVVQEMTALRGGVERCCPQWGDAVNDKVL